MPLTPIPQLRPEDLSQLQLVSVSEGGAFFIGYDQDDPAKLVRIDLADLTAVLGDETAARVAADIALQSAINLKADDSAVVKLTGNQGVAGNKTFTGISDFSLGGVTFANEQIPQAAIDGLATTLSLKANANNAVFSGTVTVPDGALAIADTSGLQAALDDKIGEDQKGVANGVAELDENGDLVGPIIGRMILDSDTTTVPNLGEQFTVVDSLTVPTTFEAKLGDGVTAGGIAMGGDWVDTTSNQTIDGEKSFTETVTLLGASTLLRTVDGATTVITIGSHDGLGASIGNDGVLKAASGAISIGDDTGTMASLRSDGTARFESVAYVGSIVTTSGNVAIGSVDGALSYIADNGNARFVDVHASGDARIDGTIEVGTGPTTLTDVAGKIFSAALNTVAVAQGGTGTTTSTGSGSVVLSASPTFTGTVGGVTAAMVANTPAGTIAATTVQAAINELDSDKLATGGNAASATVAATITVVDSTDATSSILMVDSATGNLAAKTDAGLTYNASTGALSATKYLLMGGSRPAGSITEVSNQLLDYGVNYAQLGDRDTAATGAFFRIDTRVGSESEMFSVFHQDTGGGAASAVFMVSSTGAVVAGGTVTATGFIGNASTATTLQTARTINGVSFNGSANISVPSQKLTGYTVGTLPAATVGDTAYVTDALAPTYGVAVTGGGAVITPVFYNGSNWTCR